MIPVYKHFPAKFHPIRSTIRQILGLLERRTPHKRIRWKDVSLSTVTFCHEFEDQFISGIKPRSRWLYDDYVEIEPGPLDALKEHLDDTTYDRNDALGGIGRYVLSHISNIFSHNRGSILSKASYPRGTGDGLDKTSGNVGVQDVTLDIVPAGSLTVHTS